MHPRTKEEPSNDEGERGDPRAPPGRTVGERDRCFQLSFSRSFSGLAGYSDRSTDGAETEASAFFQHAIRFLRRAEKRWVCIISLPFLTIDRPIQCHSKESAMRAEVLKEDHRNRLDLPKR